MIEIVQGKGGLPFAQIANAAGQASVCLLGATVTAYQPAGQAPVLWTSPNSRWEDGEPIRGGIPVCWPWFGAAPKEGLPAHGFARNHCWAVEQTVEEGGQSTLLLATHDDHFSQAMWPHHYHLTLTVSLGAGGLAVTLATTNPAGGHTQPFEFSAALHSYFHVSDISAIRIRGLEGTRYLSKVHDFAEFVEPGEVVIDQRVDRVYLETEKTCVIEDAGLKRKIIVEKPGMGNSRTTVVWNPWESISTQMADLGAGQYRHFVCLETVLGPLEHKVLQPGQTHELAALIRADTL